MPEKSDWDEDPASPDTGDPAPRADPGSTVAKATIDETAIQAPQKKHKKDDELDNDIRDLEHLSFNRRLSSRYRNVCARAAKRITEHYYSHLVKKN